MVAERPSPDTQRVGESQESHEVSPCHRAHAQDGATSVEYGLLAALLGVVFIVAGPTLWQAFLNVLEVIFDGMVG
jgi:Flp pilus assembly pilin Flp